MKITTRKTSNNKKLIYVLVVLLLCFSIGLAGCENIEDYSLALGTYELDGDGIPMEFELTEGKAFTFYSLLSSAMPLKGSYSIKNRQLILNTGTDIFYFDLDNGAILFNKGASTIENTTHTSSLADGASFVKVGPDRCRLDHNLGEYLNKDSKDSKD